MKRLVQSLAVLAVVLLLPAAGAALTDDHQCSYCHNVHGLVPPEQLTQSLCLTCHGPGGISVYRAASHEGVSCLVCHDSHDNRQNWLGGTNIKLIGRKHDASGEAKIAIPLRFGGGVKDVVFESRGTDAGEPALHSFHDNDQDRNGVRDGICEVCHSGRHNTGRTCTVCHSHAQGFQPR